MAARDDNSPQDSNHRKHFDRWNEQKKALNAYAEPLYFREGEIWWVHLGANIGYEIDGKSDNFARPVIVLRKYNKYSFLALPLTTSARPSAWKLPLGIVGGKPSFAILSQPRNIDSRRLYQKVASLAPEILATIRSETLRANFNAGPSNQK
jgi:mRNA interferase MazF